MSAPAYVHLRLHSEYSIVDGTVRVDDAVRAAADDGMPALALTDGANLFGLVKFYQAARAAGVKPIAGCDAWITHATERDAPFRALLLATGRDGYLKLCDWLTRASLENARRGRAEIDPAWFDERHRTASSRCPARATATSGRRCSRATRTRPPPRRSAGRARFPGRYYLEVQRAGREDDDALVDATVRLAADLGLPVVATHPIQFLAPDDFRAHEARVCIAQGHVLSDPRRPHAFTPDQWFLPTAEMTRRFADLPEALANSVAIARRCNLALPLGKAHLPDFPVPDGVTLEQHLEAEAHAGLERRLAQLFPGRGDARPRAPGVRSAARVRDEDHRADGLRRLLPDRRRLHQLGEGATACRSAPDAARAPARSPPTASASPTSIRCATSCCSSASSTPSACRCRTSTSTSARTAATA